MLQPVWTYSGSNGDTYSGLFRKWGLGTQITTNAPMGDIVVPGKIMAGHAGEAYGLVSDVFFEINNEFGIVFITTVGAVRTARRQRAPFMMWRKQCSTLHTRILKASLRPEQ